ncbi:MAG: arginase family protein [Acidobacteriota bacterium]
MTESRDSVPAVILDFDGSVSLDGASVIPLREREEEIRFACSKRSLRSLAASLAPFIHSLTPVVFLGSGDFHHVTLPLIERMGERGRMIQVVVFDNHPDNMRFPFGIHCGSWVWHVSRLPFVSRVHVAGITSSDVERGHIWENHLDVLRSGKVVYWCVERDLSALAGAGALQSRSFPTMLALLEALGQAVAATSEPVYLSIDKDVLAHDVVQTNWDQGVMRLEELESAIGMMRGRIIGSDVVGDVSLYRYRHWFRRLLSGLDHQPAIPPQALPLWQANHREVNRRLLTLLTR